MTNVGRAQDQAPPTIRILPEDIVQDSVHQFRMSQDTNKFIVRWTYTEAGAKKMLAFWNAHSGHEVITQVGSFEARGPINPLGTKPPGWTDEGWLKHRTDKFLGVSEGDAKMIVAGLESR